MAISKPCPRCQEPMEIPQPVPEKIQCAKCGVVVKFAKAATPAAAKSAPPMEAPSKAFDFDTAKPAANKAKTPEPPPGDEPKKPAPKRTGGGMLSYLHTVIPKPILFGFYGALGGLLGVILFGEVLWLTLAPKPLEPVLLKLAVPAEVAVFKGNENKLTVRVQRQKGYDGDVRLEVLDAPWDVTIPATTIPADKNEAEILLSANEGADDKPHKVTMRAAFTSNANYDKTIEPWKKEHVRVKEQLKTLANDLAKDLAKDHPSPGVRDQLTQQKEKLDARTRELEELLAIKEFTVAVDPKPPTLQVSVPELVTVYAGGQNRFGFQVARRGFPGPVRLEVLDLPKGVVIPMIELPEPAVKKKPAKDEKANTEEEVSILKGEMNIIVAKEALKSLGRDAEAETHFLELELRALKKHKITTTIKIQVRIEPPPGKLQVAAPQYVTVYPGTKNKFMVRISRQEFTAPVEIKVTGLKRTGVTIASATILEGKSEAELEVEADKDVPLGDQELLVMAKALVAEKIETSRPMTLKIVAPPPTIQIAVSPKVSAYPGGKGTFGVKIARQRFTGPVRISGQAGLATIVPIEIPADKSETEVEVNVGAAALGQALPQNAKLEVVATALKGAPTNREPMQVEILPPPSDLQLTVSPEVDIYQAGKCKFTVKVARSGFLGPVQLSFSNKPAGVTFTAPAISGDQIVVNAAASLDVEPKKYEIDVTGTGPIAPDKKTPTTTRKFILNVKPFDPTLRPPLDIVFVLDVTTSMDDPILGVKNGIGQFVQALKARDLDARIALVAFRDITEENASHPFFEYMDFTTDTKAFSARVGKLVAAGGGDGPESSLDAMEKAANQPFRGNALRVLMLITDHEPQTKGNSLKMPTALKILTDKKVGQIHLIVKKKDLPKYAPLHTIAKGGVFDFDDVAKNKKGGFVGLLPMLSKEILTTIGAPEPVALVPKQPDSAPPPTAPPGEKAPEPRAELGVSSPRPETPVPPKAGEAPIIKSADPEAPKTEIAEAPRAETPPVSGAMSSALYAAEDRVQLLIATASLTAAIALGIALLLVGAQNRYLRGTWMSLGEVSKAGAGGLIAGMFAGVLGQLFYQITSGSSAWDIVSRVVAWMILGGLIGGGMGFFVPNLKLSRAVIGGCIGGAIGAGGFVLATYFAGALLGRWLGAALLGFCIGVMVALAEVAFRRYWLEVAFGREVRTVTLGPTMVALGGDDKIAGVFVPGAIPKALGYRVDRHRVICEDFATGKTADAPPGDERTLEGAKVRVCSAASAQAIGVSLQIVVTRELALMEGMPLTAEDIPGLEPQGSDGVVAIVNRRPNNPKIFVLRNRSKQPWQVTEADGTQRKVDPGMGVELSNRSEVNFGQVKATLDPSVVNAEVKKPERVKAE